MYHRLLKRNINLAYIRVFFQFLIFPNPIWYSFETRFVTPAILGIIYGMTHLIALILELPTGALADLIGRKKTIIWGLTLYGLGALFLSQAQSAAWLWTTYIIFGFAEALISGSDVALNYDTLKELKQEKHFAKFNAKMGLFLRSALILSTFLGGYIYAIHFRLPYVLWGLSILISALFTYFLVEPKIDSAKFTLKTYLLQTKLGFRQLFKSSYIKTFSLYYLLVGGIGWYFIYFLAVAYLTDIGFNHIHIGILLSLAYAFGAIGNYWLTKISWLKSRHVYLSLPTILLFGLLPGIWTGKLYAVLALPLVLFVGLTRFTLLDDYANQEFDSKYRATAVSALNMAVGLFYVLASAVGGIVIQRYGASTMMTILGLVALLIILPVTKSLVHHDQH